MFSQNDEVSLLVQEIKITVFVSKNKIWTFRQKLELQKTCISHHNLDNLPIVNNFSDETNGDINKYVIFIYIL